LGAAESAAVGQTIPVEAPPQAVQSGDAISPAATGLPPDEAKAGLPTPDVRFLPPPRLADGSVQSVRTQPDPFGTATAPACEPPAAPGFWAQCKRRLQHCFLGYPSEFEAPPLGDSIHRHYTTHVANAEAARMVLYDYDFLPGGAALNWRGRDRLAEIQTLLPRNFCPVVVERTPGCPQLAESRRLAVLTELGQGPFPTPAERVVIGPPIAVGLPGVEAEILYQNLLQQTRGQAAASGAAAGVTGAAGQPSGSPASTTAPSP
jgi:hypothetical protein